ncbi:hypothetical protein [Planctobacterium marinum]|uniref:Uncharacterized protein n=1 Tax=Planctobacterium marinum TaxID=1631968 RepID=A0AA48HIE4_9ALTE|nr:hypothetical protein MACH26_25020 [Planctobacterium marinum]
MKFNIALKILLLVAIVFKSFLAVSTPIESHPVDIEHLQQTHDHAEDQHSNQSLTDAAGHDVEDCHHCGHCTGSHITWLQLKPHKTSLPSAVGWVFHNNSAKPSGICRDIYRPPTA